MKVQIYGKDYEAKVTTEHAASSYGKPVMVLRDADVIVSEDPADVIVLEDNQALGTADVASLGVRLVQASVDEIAGLVRGGYAVRWAPPEAPGVRA